MNPPTYERRSSHTAVTKHAAARKLQLGMQVKVRRSSGGTRDVTIKSIDHDSGLVRVRWDEGGCVMEKSVTAAEIVTLNNL